MRKKEDYDWYCIADPGTSGSAFAVLFAAIDPYLPFVFWLDEIYEKDPEKTITPYIGPKIIEKCFSLNDNPQAWKCYYDSAAAWFGAHFRKSFSDPDSPNDSGLRFSPVEKRPGEKEEGLDTLNSLFVNNQIAISLNCPNTIWEFDNYCRDANGRLPKRNDHEVDNGRYLVKIAGIIAGVSVNRSSVAQKRRAKNSRDYGFNAPSKKVGKLNLNARVIKPYEYD